MDAARNLPPDDATAAQETAAQEPAARPSPVMEQYLEIKAANPDSLLFYRMGDFYELFFEDAEIASRALGIVLTKRGKHLGQDIPMCGVPVHRSDEYLHRLIAQGHRVAVCEQLEDPAEAKKLLAEAGYGPSKPLVVKTLISASGSGQMSPLPMNEFIQQNLADVGIKVEYDVVDWNQMINIWRAGALDPASKGDQAINYSYFIQDPFTGLVRHLHCDLRPPKGTNWGLYCDPEMDKLLDEVKTTFDPKEQTAVLQKVHEKYVDDALFLMVTHDVNGRAISPKVKGFVQAKNWFQDFSPITMDK